MTDSLLRETLGDEFELFILGKLIGRPDKRLVGMIYGFLAILGKIFRRVNDVEDADRKCNWNRIKDVIRPFVTCDGTGQYQNQKNGWKELTIEIARGRSRVKVDRNEFCNGFNKKNPRYIERNCTYQ